MHVTESWSVELSEVSGLGARSRPNTGEVEVLAVGDEGFDVLVGRCTGSGWAWDQRPAGLPPSYRKRRAGSDWEAVAGDASGTVFVLCERTSELLVLSPELELIGTVSLRHPWVGRSEPSLESILLLREGHILAATQRKPAVLVELAPRGHQPLGAGRHALLGTDEAFTASPESELCTVATWELSGKDEVRSVNDLAHDGESVFLVSSASRCLARLGELRSGQQQVPAERVWRLPDPLRGRRAGRAEGLLIDSRAGVFVALDAKRERQPALFQVDLG